MLLKEQRSNNVPWQGRERVNLRSHVCLLLTIHFNKRNKLQCLIAQNNLYHIIFGNRRNVATFFVCFKWFQNYTLNESASNFNWMVLSLTLIYISIRPVIWTELVWPELTEPVLGKLILHYLLIVVFNRIIACILNTFNQLKSVVVNLNWIY